MHKIIVFNEKKSFLSKVKSLLSLSDIQLTVMGQSFPEEITIVSSGG